MPKFVIIVCAWVANIFAISGTVDSSNNHWGTGGNVPSPVILNESVFIDSGIVLLIEPGTEIQMSKIGMRISNRKGRIIAKGTYNNWITFKPQSSTPHLKDYLVIEMSFSRQNIFKFCKFEYTLTDFYNSANDTIQNCIFYYNINPAVIILNSNVYAVNNTIYTLDYFVTGIWLSDQISSTIIKNNIVAQASSGIKCAKGPGSQTIAYNIVNPTINDYSECRPIGLGNLTDDPLLVDPQNGNFHLQPGSPAIDAGDPADDYSLEPGDGGGRINMGAYGNTPEATLNGSNILPLFLSNNNPGNSRINQILIYDISGQIIKTLSSGNNDNFLSFGVGKQFMNSSNFSNGVYFLRGNTVDSKSIPLGKVAVLR